MARQNWEKLEGGFILHGHRLSTEEIKAINARLDGRVHLEKSSVRIPRVVLPPGWIPSAALEGASSRVREDRLNLLHSLGEQMLESYQQA